MASARPAVQEAVAVATLSVGSVVDSDYEVLESLGRGAASEVFRARQRGAGREAALKILDPPGPGGVEGVQRMLRECRLLAELDHPNAVHILSIGQVEPGRPYVAMELIRGRTLSDLVAAEGPLEASRIAEYLGQIASVLDAAHARGIVHRDLKPNNVMVVVGEDGRERVKVLDFGAAKVLHPDAGMATVVTTAGLTLGTPATMSPEQAMGRPIDAKSDVYSLGATLYAVLTGKYPFEGRTDLQTMLAHVQSPVPAMAQRNPRAKVPPAVERVVAWALEKEPSNRPASAGELSLAFSKALMETLEEPAEIPPPASAAQEEFRGEATASAREDSPAMWALAIGLTALLVAAAFWFLRFGP